MPLDATPLDLASLPPILAGPILRRLTRTEMAVWVALSSPSPVTVHVQVAGQPATSVSGPAVTPTPVGQHLWLAVATAPGPGGTFGAGQRYAYFLDAPGWSSPPDWSGVAMDGTLPSFPAPPAAPEDLTLLHTSCRKVHGGGRDGLGTAVELVRDRIAAGGPGARPHLIVMSGDQIYADEVPAPVAPRIRRIAADLVGIDETDVFGPLPAIGGRQGPCQSFGFTSAAAADHLWTFGEFCASYLLAWSDVLWPASLPAWTDVDPAVDLDPAAGLDEAAWNDLLADVGRFRATLADVRRLLATVPSLMVLDDHEVTDDWNLDYPWAAAVYASAPGSRVVFNGVLAYALFQHWGNEPHRFTTPGAPETALLAAVAPTGASPDRTATRGLLGVPTAPPPAPPSTLRDLSDAGAIRYDFSLGPDDGWPVRFLALDERTAREFLRVDHPAARISMAALALMVAEPAPPPPAPTFVVAPSPILGTHVVEHVVQPLASLFPGGAEYADFESWSAAVPNHEELLRRLALYSPLVFLSGDVHYSTTSSMAYVRGSTDALGAQITSSAAKNADAKTMTLSVLGEFAMRVGLERARRYIGFAALSDADRASLASPPAAGTSLDWDDLVDVLLGRVFRAGQERPAVLSGGVATAYGLGSGDWHYDVTPADDQTMPDPGTLLTDINGAPDGWDGWDPMKSFSMLRAMRAADLHRIGRVYDGLPQISLIELTTAPLTVHHHLVSPVGDDVAAATVQHTDTSVVLA